MKLNAEERARILKVLQRGIEAMGVTCRLVEYNWAQDLTQRNRKCVDPLCQRITTAMAEYYEPFHYNHGLVCPCSNFTPIEIWEFITMIYNFDQEGGSHARDRWKGR